MPYLIDGRHTLVLTRCVTNEPLITLSPGPTRLYPHSFFLLLSGQNQQQQLPQEARGEKEKR